jgi:uncharacterized protein YneF (UPF0154 family)
MSETDTKKTSFFKAHYVLFIILFLAAVAAGGAGYYYYQKYTAAQQLLSNPNLAVERETNDLVMQVGRLMVLPGDETPAVATVTDAEKLKEQEFFKNAENGYKVLIYTNAKKAILYDPVRNIIVNVSPVNLAGDAQAPAVTPSPSPRATATPTAAASPSANR